MNITLHKRHPAATLRRMAYPVLLFTFFLLASGSSTGQQLSRTAPVTRVDSVGVTVSDMDRSVTFFANILSFEKISDTEVAGEDYEHLEGLFGLRMRIVRMKLGEEFITLTEYLAPKGRPIPVDSRSNDRWFQHIAIITSDMDKAYALLRQNKVEHASSGPDGKDRMRKRRPTEQPRKLLRSTHE